MTVCAFRTNSTYFIQAKAVHRKKEKIIRLEYNLLV